MGAARGPGAPPQVGGHGYSPRPVSAVGRRHGPRRRSRGHGGHPRAGRRPCTPDWRPGKAVGPVDGAGQACRVSERPGDGVGVPWISPPTFGSQGEIIPPPPLSCRALNDPGPPRSRFAPISGVSAARYSPPTQRERRVHRRHAARRRSSPRRRPRHWHPSARSGDGRSHPPGPRRVRPGGIERAEECQNIPLPTHDRVNLDLWYTGPPTKGGHSHGHVTVRRSPDPLARGPGFDQSHRGRVSAVGPVL